MVKVNLGRDVMRANDAIARKNQRTLEDAGILAVDVMGSPGSGKTTVLERTLQAVGRRRSISVIEGDVCTARDAERVAAQGAQVVQINTGGACHLDAEMIRDALGDMCLHDQDLLFIENVGNLICPAGYRLGEAERVMVLSVTEGVDKPEKYPAMFRSCSLALINKIDLFEMLPLRPDDFVRAIREVQPDMRVMPVSALTGEGMEEWYRWIERKMGDRRRRSGR